MVLFVGLSCVFFVCVFFCFFLFFFLGGSGGGGLIQDILKLFNDLVLVHHALHPVLLLQ